jgi:hypothetical protein
VQLRARPNRERDRWPADAHSERPATLTAALTIGAAAVTPASLLALAACRMSRRCRQATRRRVRHSAVAPVLLLTSPAHGNVGQADLLNIISAIEDELISIVRSLTTAKDTWPHASTARASPALSVRVASTSPADHGPSHIAKLNNIMYDKLVDIGEADHVLVLLSSLPDTYNNVTWS